MADNLLSVGIDVGTTTTQLLFSRLTVDNTGGSFSVPRLQITGREILYRGKVHLTPLVNELVDVKRLRQLLLQEYAAAGFCPEQVDTGAVIVTGETSRRENAAAALEAVSDLAGDFVVTTAGPELESVLAAKGAGALEYSRSTDQLLLHMDIGGGTANLALMRRGQILQSGCLNVGGRLIRVDGQGKICYVSPAVASLTQLRPGQQVSLEALQDLVRQLTQALEMAAGKLPVTPLLAHLQTKEVRHPWEVPREEVTLSFSGGVAECISREISPFLYGDIGPLLGSAIRDSSLCRDAYRISPEAIRATVIGAGCHSTQLSGSTVFCRGTELPLRDLPVVSVESAGELEEQLRRGLDRDEVPVFYFPGPLPRDYGSLRQLSSRICAALQDQPIRICLKQDLAKALGQLLWLQTQQKQPVLCIDALELEDDSFLDVGQPTGPCFPVVIKTLVLSSAVGKDQLKERSFS